MIYAKIKYDTSFKVYDGDNDIGKVTIPAGTICSVERVPYYEIPYPEVLIIRPVEDPQCLTYATNQELKMLSPLESLAIGGQ